MAGKWFKKCDDDVKKIAAGLMFAKYPELVEVDLRIDLIFAHAPPPKEGAQKQPALKHHGYPAAGICKINSLEQRVRGLGDVTILLDGDEWPHWSEKRQKAVIQHELEHVVIQRDKEGQVKADDIGRPKIKLKNHDWECGGFANIAKEYGDDAFEKEAMVLVADKYGQLLFPWG